MSDNHYDTYEKRLDTILGPKAVVWARIRQARAEFDEEYKHVPDIAEDNKHFVSWLSWTYGIQLKLDATFAVESIFEIINNKKYTVFLLKYS